jgi:hypothetical protein
MEKRIFNDSEINSIELRLDFRLLSGKFERNVSESSHEMAGSVNMKFTSSSGLALASMNL